MTVSGVTGLITEALFTEDWDRHNARSPARGRSNAHRRAVQSVLLRCAPSTCALLLSGASERLLFSFPLSDNLGFSLLLPARHHLRQYFSRGLSFSSRAYTSPHFLCSSRGRALPDMAGLMKNILRFSRKNDPEPGESNRTCGTRAAGSARRAMCGMECASVTTDRVPWRQAALSHRQLIPKHSSNHLLPRTTLRCPPTTSTRITRRSLLRTLSSPRQALATS